MTGPATSASTAASRDDVLAEAVTRLVMTCRPVKIILFGSTARDRARSDSDLDLLIEIDDEERWEECSKDAIKAVARLALDIDVVVTTTARVSHARGTPGSVVRRALREGTVVYQRAA
jgi:predicted nucleotidyltransferase